MEVIIFASNVNLGRFAMVSDVEIFLIGIAGGILGSGLVILTTLFHFQQTVKQHVKIKVKLKEMIDVKRLQDDVNTLRIQVVALQSQFGGENDR